MFSEKLLYLRKKHGYSQEKLAELSGVTRQAIQKWERGASVPDADRLVMLSKLFGVTVDSLLTDENSDSDAARRNIPIIPEYEKLHMWEAYFSQLDIELRECTDEGRDVAAYAGLVAEIAKLPANEYKKRLADVIYDLFMSANQTDGYRYCEPSEYPLIKPLCSGAEKRQPPPDIALRIEGAWLGRICGCILGKPVECMKLNELVPFLKESGNYPMKRYILTSDVTAAVREKYSYPFWIDCFADKLVCCPSDDDTNYTVLASRMIDKYGADFKSSDVASMWIDSQVKNAYCTAERVAYCNIINGYAPPETAIYHNPYLEWIGAQIRADYYGYIYPGDPEAAAEAAYRDARVSHVKNGIYGAMFAAATVAAAAVSDSTYAALRQGISCIPVTSRLYEYLRGVLDGYDAGSSFDDFTAKLRSDWNDNDPYDWCHVIPNAAIVTAALLYGGGDYGKTVCLAVQSGFDTDCNGATAGSVAGMLLGKSAIGKWADPVHGMLDTTLAGVGRVSISELVAVTLKHILKR